jgi:hypothetical protein
MMDRGMVARRTKAAECIYLEFFQRSFPLTALVAVATEHSQGLNLFPRGFIKIYLQTGNQRNIALESGVNTSIYGDNLKRRWELKYNFIGR